MKKSFQQIQTSDLDPFQCWVSEKTSMGTNSEDFLSLGPEGPERPDRVWLGSREKIRNRAGLEKPEGVVGTEAQLGHRSASLPGVARRPSHFSEQPETQAVKQNLLTCKCWKPVCIFKNTEETKETPLEPWAARGHLCFPGGKFWPS